ncbi:MAG: glucose-1-phosphate adenylyltransferase [Peptococcaceae bacterium]|jgi:glucose-1-phosphate adenylyltransferase|nr:glucose-1-phosphate adenylyltransferase [Peptococcaceae bacterium]MDH7525672.1 glucose-1-phosphate adenylyltransferase [Peptococcaceae bacterium]
MPRKECIAMLLAGGQGSRLGCLTKRIAKPAVPFGGKYRIIDFSLSNCSNSGIDTVGVLTQYKPTLLNSYIGVGSAWDLDVGDGGVYVLPPYMGEKGGEWYKGTANAVYQNLDFIEHYDPRCVLVISGDHIYKMDYSLMLEYHRQKQADVTIAVIEVPRDETKRFGIVRTDEEGRVTEFKEKPKEAASNLASMGVYIFNWSVLKEHLAMDENDPSSDHDFGKNVIPRMLGEGVGMYAYRFRGYWKDVGTIESYYAANMDLLKRDPEFDIFEDYLKVYSKAPVLPPHFLGPRAEVRRALVPDGCVILGEVENSVLFTGVYIGEGSKVIDSIIMPKVEIGEGCMIKKTIIGENTIVGDECRIGYESGDEVSNIELTVIADNVTLPGRVRVKKSSQIAGWRQSKIS